MEKQVSKVGRPKGIPKQCKVSGCEGRAVSLGYCQKHCGIKGLCFISSQNIWQGKITVDGQRFVKRSIHPEVCIAWLKKMRPKLHGEYAYEG